MKNDFMQVALEEAKKAFEKNEVPVGAIIVKNNKIIAKAHNLKSFSHDIFNHAEIFAIKLATKKIGDWRLNECEMYVTLEPCPMCASAIQQSRIKKVFIGTKSNIKSNSSVIKSIFNNKEFNHIVDYEYLNSYESSKLLSDFFSLKR